LTFAEVLNAQAAMVSHARAFLNPQKRLIRIGTSSLLNTTLLGLFLDPFRREYPDYEIILREMNMAELYRMLDQGLLDYVFGVVDRHKERWASRFLYEEPLLYVARAGTKQTGTKSPSVDFKNIAKPSTQKAIVLLSTLTDCGR
jgi:DNA-binding transcriptional LysR family regulator